MNRIVWLCVLLIFFSFKLFAETFEPQVVFLTWLNKPEQTMLIRWLSPQDKPSDTVLYHKINETHWKQATGSHITLPSLKNQFLHSVELLNLEPNTQYVFKPGEGEIEFKFRTLAEGKKIYPLRFVVGGDIYHDGIKYVEETNKQAAKTNPHFAIIGGDIAYASKKFSFQNDDGQRWIEWLASWTKTMITPDGNLIPFLGAIGNHDVNGRYKQTPTQAPYYYAIFDSWMEEGFRVIDLSGEISFILLDSDHTHPINDDQAAWLDQVLKYRKNIPYKFAIYHVPAYPSVQSYRAQVSADIRKWWVPLFEKYGLTTAFEHHGHAYKRTFRIKNNAVDPNGVLYIGDGGWGVKKIRKPHTPEELWYLEKSEPRRHFILVTLNDEQSGEIKAIDFNGEVFDQIALKQQDPKKLN